jgi:hypothetical protein
MISRSGNAAAADEHAVAAAVVAVVVVQPASAAVRPPPGRRPRRRGITAAIAMIFMVLIGALAIGFYSTITTSTSIAHNDHRGARALLAAESGVQFMRLHLARVKIPATASTTADTLVELHKDLKAAMEPSGNLGARTVGLSGGVITIPAEAGGIIEIESGDHTGFRVAIQGGATGGVMICKVTGSSGTGRNQRNKTVTLDFIRHELPSNMLNNAVAAQGTVNIMKGIIGGVPLVSPDTIASVMSTKASAPAVAVSGGTLGGNVGVIDDAYAQITGGSVAGQTDLTTIYANHVKEIEPPEFPVVDTTMFASFATNTYVSGMSSPLQNVRIPSNTNPKFSGGVAIQGILYIESPNQVEFIGGSSLAGFLVFENKGTSATNTVKFAGNTTISGLPPDAVFNPLRAITGVAIMAPTASVTMTGSTDSYLKGNVFVGQFNELGSATIKIDQGSIVAMDTGTAATFNGQTTRFLSTGALNPPSVGVRYSAKFVPVDGTYHELN